MAVCNDSGCGDGYLCEDCRYSRLSDEERAIFRREEDKAICYAENEFYDWLSLCNRQKWYTVSFLLLGFKRWSRRALDRVEAEYAPDGPRGRQIIQEWSM